MSPISRLKSIAARHHNGRLALAVSGAYTVVVQGTNLAVIAFMLLADDPGFVAVWAVFVSLPLSLPGLFVSSQIFPPDDLPDAVDLLALMGPCVAAGAFQAWVLWVLLRGRRLRPAEAGNGGNRPAEG
ncbi:MAG TPA: hypothetical protein VHJ17_05545 [Thermomonospora sp.]|nr:hypothetical protein [Thermomonospora sp.]